MSSERFRANVFFWLQWFAVSSLGWICGLLIFYLVEPVMINPIKSLIIADSLNWQSGMYEAFYSTAVFQYGFLQSPVPSDYIGVRLAFRYGLLFGTIRGAVFGAVGGAIQSLLLLRYLPVRFVWLLASGLGWAIIWGIFWGIACAHGGNQLDRILKQEVQYGLAGALFLGCLQWWILRQHMAKAYRWIIATTASWAVIHMATVTFMWQTRTILTLTPNAMMFGICNGAITGLALVSLHRLPESDKQFS